MLRFFYKPVCVFMSLCITTGCKTENMALTAFKSYAFDTAVIAKLPLYDSLTKAISENIGLIHKHIHVDDSYHAFRYMPAAKDAEVFTKMPAEIGGAIDRHFNNIGKNYIYAIDVFKDSTIKIYIRKRTLDSKVEMEETLGYYPPGKTIGHREYPTKDTILNAHWQYRARFDNPGFF